MSSYPEIHYPSRIKDIIDRELPSIDRDEPKEPVHTGYVPSFISTSLIVTLGIITLIAGMISGSSGILFLAMIISLLIVTFQSLTYLQRRQEYQIKYREYQEKLNQYRQDLGLFVTLYAKSTDKMPR